MRLVDRLHLDSGLLPIFVLTLSLMVFAAAGTVGGSGFLAVYLAGLIAGVAWRAPPYSIRQRRTPVGSQHSRPPSLVASTIAPSAATAGVPTPANDMLLLLISQLDQSMAQARARRA